VWDVFTKNMWMMELQMNIITASSIPKKTKLAFYFAGLIHLHPSSPICGLPDQNSDPHPDLEKGPLDNLGSPAALKIRWTN